MIGIKIRAVHQDMLEVVNLVDGSWKPDLGVDNILCNQITCEQEKWTDYNCLHLPKELP